MRLILQRILAGALLLVVVAFACDWLAYRYRAAHGTAFDSVPVKQFSSVPLKNGRDELDYMGTQPVDCVRSIFPWAGDDPCWWVRRHADRWSKI
ncbi:MAG TPA: hypothetical protein VHB45_12825 [Alloacidobacterium sp.]|nr:hypothetical protein [Alloacidobacterium sp.]